MAERIFHDCAYCTAVKSSLAVLVRPSYEPAEFVSSMQHPLKRVSPSLLMNDTEQ